MPRAKKSTGKKTSKKTFVLDTNILMTSPYAIYAFDEHDICIVDITLEELDNNKTRNGEAGANAREVIRLLEDLRQRGNLLEGVSLPGGGKFRIEVNHLNAAIPESWDPNKPDNRILRVCSGLKAENDSPILVTNDINMRIKAGMIGVEAEEYKTEQVFKPSEQYKGRRSALVSAKAIDNFYRDKRLAPDVVLKKADFTPEINEFFLLKDANDEKHSALCRFDGTMFVPLNYDKCKPYGVSPRNVGQKFAQEALLASVIDAPLVILKGPAGTSKTFYSLACGLEGVMNRSLDDGGYNEILVARPNVKFDEDIGYLKGSEEEKINPLMRPIYDNLKELTRISGKEEKDGVDCSNYAQDLFDRGIISAQAMAYMRGRSVPRTWIIIDEAQNMSPTQAFGIISRAGINSKIILAGDIDQIDNPRLDSRTNGLSYASERMKGNPLCWQMTFTDSECVRSPLALAAISNMSPKGYNAKSEE